MGARLATFAILVLVAARNLRMSRARTLAIGGVVTLGAMLVVVLGALVTGLDDGMRRSVQESLGGHIQLTNSASREPLALYGGVMGDADLTPITSFTALQGALAGVEDIELLVPMGIGSATIVSASALERAIDALRAASRADLPVKQAEVRHLLELLHRDLAHAGELALPVELDDQDRADLTRAMSAGFWREFEHDPKGALAFLDERIAPLSLEERIERLRYVGTDLDVFARAFPRMRIVAGKAVPPGARGILLSRFFVERDLKLRVEVGDTVTLRAFTKAGYMRSINVEVYGFFEILGLERAAFAGETNLLDLASFRELFGYPTAADAAELSSLTAELGVRHLERDEVEAALFGGEAAPAREHEPRATTVLGDDVVLNVAVILRDARRLDAAMVEIERAARAAGIEVTAVTWQEAAGLVGRLITLARLTLYAAALIIFIVMMVIIDSALVMATLGRVRELGTIRAIGAPKRFVFMMVLTESAVAGVSFGALGAALGVAVIALVRASGGISTSDEHLSFIFSGPTFMPDFGAAPILAALAFAFVASVLVGLYPARLATRVAPLLAMQKEE